MSSKPMFGDWLVAIAEAAEVAGAADVEVATVEQMTRAWGLVTGAAEISLDELTRRIAEQVHVARADLHLADRRTSALLPADVAHRRNVLPLRCTDTGVWVATSNPLSHDTRREVADLTGRSVTFEVADPGRIAAAVLDVYGPPPEPTSRGARRGTHGATGPHVLVVDDEAGQRTLFRSVLEEAGFRVDVANDGPSAVELLSENPAYDLITLDYWMDKMNGLRVLQHIRAHRSPTIAEVPVVMVTGADDRRIEMSLFEAGADDYIPKPIDAPLFVLRAQAVLRRRGYL